jgi:hypothetical protein
MLVTSAAAEIAGDGLTDFLFIWIGIILQERHQSHQYARGTETTLCAVRFLESFLDDMQVFGIPKAFDCLYLVSICLDGKHQTGADGLSIEQDCTGTADTMFTCDVSTGQAEVMTQEITQQDARFYFALVLGSIDSNSKLKKITHNSLLIEIEGKSLLIMDVILSLNWFERVEKLDPKRGRSVYLPGGGGRQLKRGYHCLGRHPQLRRSRRPRGSNLVLVAVR